MCNWLDVSVALLLLTCPLPPSFANRTQTLLRWRCWLAAMTMASSPATSFTQHNTVAGDDVLVAADPFATPPAITSQLPSRPTPAALGRPIQPHDQSPHAAFPIKSASMSSAGTGSTTRTGSIDCDEKSGSMEGVAEPPTKSRHFQRDPEKALQSPTRHSRYSRDRHSRGDISHRTYIEDDDVEESRQVQENKALKILFFLAGPCAVLSTLNAFWTIISLFITIMTQPVRLCARRPGFGQQLGGLVGPALNLQLKSIYTPLAPHADEDTTYKPGMLVLVMLLSPFLGMGMMLAAWVAAIYWVSSLVVGDPAGLDKRDDGRETVLALRKWWENWLVRSIRNE